MTETVRAIVREVLSAGVTDPTRLSRYAANPDFEAALADLGPKAARECAFHLTDWLEDAAFLVALALEPERFTPEQREEGLTSFLVHAPYHVREAAKVWDAS